MDQSVQSPSFSLMNYLKILFRRKALFFVPVYGGLILGICVGFMLPPQYRSSTIILVEEGKTDNPLFSNLAVSTSFNQRMTAIHESMLGWHSVVTLVKRLNMDKDITNQQQMEQLVGRIRRNVSILLRSPNIIDLSYVGPNPHTTQAIVRNITEIFIQQNLEIQDKETRDAISFIESQLHVYKGKIKSAEIAQFKDELNSLLMDSTEHHPRVKQLREQIRVKTAELEKENLEYTENAILDAKTTTPIVEEIRKALDTVEGKSNLPDPRTMAPQDKDLYYKLMLIDKLDNVMARDVDVNTQIYNMLLQRLETARITQRLQASKEGTKYTILDPPRVPLQPFSPNKFMVGFIGLFLGGLGGAGLVVLRELLDKSFLDVEEAKEYLGVPLLGAISKINTLETLRQERQRQRLFSGVAALAGIILVMITLMISRLLK